MTEAKFKPGDTLSVRKLSGTYRVTSSRVVLGKRRYKLKAISDSGALLPTTEAYENDLEEAVMPPLAEMDAQALRDGIVKRAVQIIDHGVSVAVGSDGVWMHLKSKSGKSYSFQPISLTRNRNGEEIPGVCTDAIKDWCSDAMNAATRPQEQTEPVPAPGSDPAAPDAISSPARVIGPHAVCNVPGCTHGAELDEYSDGARTPEPGPGELQNPLHKLRQHPSTQLEYSDLRNVIYQGWFKKTTGFSEQDINDLPDGTPIAVAVTEEANGCAVWVIVSNHGKLARLEVFYPKATGCKSGAIEHGVLLALGEIPIFTDELETILLQL